MKLKNLKYGFLISVSTLFGGSSVSLYAQNDKGEPHKIETVSDYKQQFLESINPNKDKIGIDFMVDSVANMTSNGDLIADVNVIELLAYLEPDSDEYQSYLAAKHIVAHEMWHRICLMKGVLEKPMSATQFRTAQDNFEITASMLPVLTFRDDYIHATPKEREALMKSTDPKIEMYVQAIQHDIVKPLSKDKKDFDFEMQFIAVMVSNFWNNNMADSYADYHNALTINSGRKEFISDTYDKNFNQDIKIMNTIGGVDFSQYYTVKSTNIPSGTFPLGNKEDQVVLKRSLDEPDYETWVNEKSQLKRYSKQRVEIPNFAGDVLAKEREARPYNQAKQDYQIMPYVSGHKSFPKANTLFMSAIELQKENKTYKLYPNGSLDEITPTATPGVDHIKTYNIDGSVEVGELSKGRKNGKFVYYDAKQKQIATCSFKNGRAQDGVMIGVFQHKRFYYTYEAGKLLNVECQNFDGTKLSACTFKNDMPVSGLMPKEVRYSDIIFDVYDKGERLATVSLDDKAQVTDSFSKKDKTLKIEKFYPNGAPHYTAKITPFKRNEILYDAQAKPVIYASQWQDKLVVRGNLPRLQQEIKQMPIQKQDKELVFQNLVDTLKTTDVKTIKAKGGTFDIRYQKVNRPLLTPLLSAFLPEGVQKLSDKKKEPRFLWRKFSFSPKPLTASVSEQGSCLGLLKNKIRSSVRSFKPAPNKKIAQDTRNRFDGRSKVRPTQKVMAVLTSRRTAKQHNA